MDFSRSLEIGENTFEEIDVCEAKVKHAGLQMVSNHTIICPNGTNIANENVENSTLHNIPNASDIKSKSETHQNFSAKSNFVQSPRNHSLTTNEPILDKGHDVKLRTVSISQK